MIKHVRTAFAAILIAFAIAFGLGPLDGYLGMSSTPSAYAGGGPIKP